jgi:hypothetical protein
LRFLQLSIIGKARYCDGAVNHNFIYMHRM